jgi:hypothetical protein
LHHRRASTEKVDLRAFVESWEGQHYLWRKDKSDQEYQARIRYYARRFLLRTVWYFSLSLLTLFLLPAFSGRFRKYFHLFKWHVRGCPPGWGLRPVKKT